MVSIFGPSFCASLIIFFISFASSVSLLIRHCIILNRPLCILPRYIVCSSCKFYTHERYNICPAWRQYDVCTDEWIVRGCIWCAFVCEEQVFLCLRSYSGVCLAELCFLYQAFCFILQHLQQCHLLCTGSLGALHRHIYIWLCAKPDVCSSNC
jgi:hypothetical protein